MITFSDHQRRFNYRVAGIVIHQGHLLVHRAEWESFFTLPGGRVELMEDAASALIRELTEELAVNATIQRLLYLMEYFFEFQGELWHEIALYFLVQLPTSLFDPSKPFFGIEGSSIKLIFHWVPLVELSDWSLYPECLKTSLLTIPAYPQHVVVKDVKATGVG